MGTIVVSRTFKKQSAITQVLEGIWALVLGLASTLRQFFITWRGRKEDVMTVEYPFEKVKRSDRFHGTHVLTKKANGSIRCTACMLCATACPAECIRIVAAESPDPHVEKVPVVYEIDALRCVFCGYCEEACPVDAIRLTPEYEFSNVASSNFIWDINFLMDRPSLKGGVLSKVPEDKPHLRFKKGMDILS
jgi:NADH-quinone oxidoreductase subunit I